MTDPRLTLEERIEAELKSYDGTMGLYMDDLKGNVITRFPDEPFRDGQYHQGLHSGGAV